MSENYGIKISKFGYDVLTTGNQNLIFSSELASHSIYAVMTVTKAVGLNSASLLHKLGFIPKVWVFQDLNDAGGDYYRRIPVDGSGLGTSIDYYITSTSVVIETESSSTEDTFVVVIFTRSPNP